MKSPDQARKVRAQLNEPETIKNDKDGDTNIELPFKPQKLKKRDIINLLYHVKVNIVNS